MDGPGINIKMRRVGFAFRQEGQELRPSTPCLDFLSVQASCEKGFPDPALNSDPSFSVPPSMGEGTPKQV